jgi:hypothetical protein
MTRAFHDPYDSMIDSDFDEHVASLFERVPERTVPVSIRWPEELLARVKRVAAEAGVPYQSLIKDFVAAALPVAERRQASRSPRRPAATPAAHKVATARKTNTTRTRRRAG